MNTSTQILADRVNHKPIARTEPEPSGFGIKGTVQYTKWDDGVVTSCYDYGDGTNTVLHVSDPDFFQTKFNPVWTPV